MLVEFGTERADIWNISKSRAADLLAYPYLVFGTSTYGEGMLQHDWDRFILELDEADLYGKKVAVFALGDQIVWSKTFVNSMGTVYDKLMDRGATIVGSWPTETYDFEESTAVRNGVFVGLPLDRHNQREMTTERIELWVRQLLREFGCKTR